MWKKPVFFLWLQNIDSMSRNIAQKHSSWPVIPCEKNRIFNAEGFRIDLFDN